MRSMACWAVAGSAGAAWAAEVSSAARIVSPAGRIAATRSPSTSSRRGSGGTWGGRELNVLGIVAPRHVGPGGRRSDGVYHRFGLRGYGPTVPEYMSGSK